MPTHPPSISPASPTDPSSPPPTPVGSPGLAADRPGKFIQPKSYSGEIAGYYYNAMNSMSAALSFEYRVQGSAPAFIMGRKVDDPKESTQQTTAHSRAVSYYTYRKRFPKPLDNGADHDAGWGCMVRTGQMMLSEAVRRILRCMLPPQPIVPPTVSSKRSMSSDEFGAHQCSMMELNRDTRFPRPQPDEIRSVATPIFGLGEDASDRVHAAASLFYDSPVAPFGIHNLTRAAAVSARLDVGQWFTPTALTRAVMHVMEEGIVAPLNPSQQSILDNDHDHLMAGLPAAVSPQQKPSSRSASDSEIGGAIPREVARDAAEHILEVFEFVRRHLRVVAPLDGAVCVDDVVELLRGSPPVDLANDSISVHEDDREYEDPSELPPPPAAPASASTECAAPRGVEVLLMIPVMAGAGGTLSEAYRTAVLRCLELPSSLGIVGGKPNKSLYFIGHQDDAVFYLDPHTVQNAFVSPRTVGTRSGPKGIAASSLIDTSMVVCFYFESENAFASFQAEYDPIAKLTPFPLFTLISKEQKVAAAAVASRVVDDDMDFEDEDDSPECPPPRCGGVVVLEEKDEESPTLRRSPQYDSGGFSSEDDNAPNPSPPSVERNNSHYHV